MRFKKGQSWYLVGIKGVGMTALAKMLKTHGIQITGSDTHEVFFTDEVLRALGITPDSFSDPLPKITGIIHSAAYDKKNPHIAEGLKRGVPVLSYTETLGEISSDYYSVGVAGTHGKTTITAWLGYALAYAGADPTVIVGSLVPQFDNSNSRVGSSKLFIAETCEYKRHFLSYHPQHIIITNIEMDHPDYYKDISDMQKAYKEYCMLLPKTGHLTIGPNVTPPVKSISTSRYGKEDWIVKKRLVRGSKQYLEISSKSFSQRIELKIKLFGEHNAENACGVLACGNELCKQFGIDWKKFCAGVEDFSGTIRRLEHVGSFHELILYDDYAHHPSEIAATLKALKEAYKDMKRIAIFMPHTFSRTEALFDEFASSFHDANETIILPVYSSARETGDPIELSKKLAQGIIKQGDICTFLHSFEKVKQYLRGISGKPHVVVTLGAGDNWKIVHELISDSEKRT